MATNKFISQFSGIEGRTKTFWQVNFAILQFHVPSLGRLLL